MEDIDQTESINGSPDRSNWWLGSSRNGKLLLIGIIALVSIGALGGGLKYLEASAKDEIAHRAINQAQLNNKAEQTSWLNTINPFLPAPLPSPTPQLSKEYVYAGSRLLAVEDANANAAGAADFAIFRSSVGQWMVLNSQTLSMEGAQWGNASDFLVPGDYDGDGKTDFATFRPSTNGWDIVRSSDSSYLGFNFGQAGDKPVAADYDGDGLTDAAVYRPSNGTWLVRRSSDGNVTGFQFGSPGDLLVPGDYDGDGKADYATFRPSTQYWYIWRSSLNNYTGEQYGLAGTFLRNVTV